MYLYDSLVSSVSSKYMIVVYMMIYKIVYRV